MSINQPVMRMDNQKALVILDSALPFAFFSKTFVNPNDFCSVEIEYFNDTLGIRPNLVNNSKLLPVEEFFEQLFENSERRDRLFSELELLGQVKNFPIPLKSSSVVDSLLINCRISRLKHGQYFLQGFLSPANGIMPKAPDLNEAPLSLEAGPASASLATSTFDTILGTSAACVQLKEEIKQIARLNTSVLLSGVHGTGKKMVAKAIHETSGRYNGPFILQSCRDISEDRLDWELFGRPASEHAVESSGLIRSARGGTLVLEEIQDLPLSLQAKLLRVLQDGEIRIPGTARYEQVDVRIIVTSIHDLEPLMRDNRFRDDLYYEICVFAIHLPSLEDRQEDIIDLAEHFLAELQLEGGDLISGIAPLAQILLKDHHWQGNVRELRQVIKRAALVCESDMIEAANLVLLGQRTVIEEIMPEENPTVITAIDEVAPDKTPIFSKNQIIETLTKNQWNKTLTAKELKMSRATLWRKLKGFSINTPADTV